MPCTRRWNFKLVFMGKMSILLINTDVRGLGKVKGKKKVPLYSVLLNSIYHYMAGMCRAYLIIFHKYMSLSGNP